MRILSVLCLLSLLLSLLLASTVHAGDPAVEAALEADDVNQDHCADLYDTKVERAASSTMAVAAAWQRVDEVYRETEASYLLFWRGVLAQCLGRDEAALADLTEFVGAQSESTMFASLVRQAKTRLRRLGDRSQLGQGASASFLRLGPALEASASWAGGVGFHELICTDPSPVGDALNVTCLGQDRERAEYGLVAVPASLQASIDGFPARAFGLGARLLLSLPAPSGLATPRAPGLTLQVQVGPQLRILDTVATGRRSGWFRAEVRFAASLTRMDPMVGQAKYYVDNGGFLDAGTWELKHVGVAARLGGALEISQKAALFFSGRFSWYAPMQGSAARRVVEAQPVELTRSVGGTVTEQVEIVPELERTTQLAAGGRVGLLFPAETVAVGPFVGIDIVQASMSFPNDSADCWVYGGQGTCITNDEDARKVYSSRRTGFFVTVGIESRFGIPRPE